MLTFGRTYSKIERKPEDGEENGMEDVGNLRGLSPFRGADLHIHDVGVYKVAFSLGDGVFGSVGEDPHFPFFDVIQFQLLMPVPGDGMVDDLGHIINGHDIGVFGCDPRYVFQLMIAEIQIFHCGYPAFPDLFCLS